METAQLETGHVDSDDYALRALIELMQQKRSSEREIEAAVREASGCLSHQASPGWTARRRRPFRVVGRRFRQGRPASDTHPLAP